MDNLQYQEYQELFGKQCSFAKQCPADKKDIWYKKKHVFLI